MTIKTIQVGDLAVNCYVVYDDDTKEAVIIDPGEEFGKIAAFIDSNALKPLAVLLTHSHFDHVCAAEETRKKYGIPIAIHRNEKRLLENEEKTVAFPFVSEPVCISPDILFEDGETYAPFTKGAGFLVLHTPGHTEGGASYYMKEEKAVFTGDTLFKMSIGRTDFPTGDRKQIGESIAEKLLPLGDETAIYPGHGVKSTIGNERERNPFLRRFV